MHVAQVAYIPGSPQWLLQWQEETAAIVADTPGHSPVHTYEQAPVLHHTQSWPSVQVAGEDNHVYNT